MLQIQEMIISLNSFCLLDYPRYKFSGTDYHWCTIETSILYLTSGWRSEAGIFMTHIRTIEQDSYHDVGSLCAGLQLDYHSVGLVYDKPGVRLIIGGYPASMSAGYMGWASSGTGGQVTSTACIGVFCSFSLCAPELYHPSTDEWGNYDAYTYTGSSALNISLGGQSRLERRNGLHVIFS